MPERALVPELEAGARRDRALADGLQRGPAAQQLRADAACEVRGAASTDNRRRRIGATANPGVISFNPADSSQSLVRVLGAGHFSSYGFPESHAASFALLVYASCWVKKHYPAEFLCAMLNSQPLGFYTPSQLVQDARRHNVPVRPVDVLYSNWDCTIEDVEHAPAVRLGMRMLTGFRKESALRIVAARASTFFESAEELARLAELEHQDMRQLAAADALRSLSGHRRQQVWDAAALRRPPKLLRDAPVDEPVLELAAAAEGEEVLWDFQTTGLTLRSHPLKLLRPKLDEYGLLKASDLARMDNGAPAYYAGVVTLRQQPETAKGVIFVSLEDESGNVQVIVWPSVRQEQTKELMQSQLLAVRGHWQRDGDACSLIAKQLEDLTPLLSGIEGLNPVVGDLNLRSRDFR